MSEAYAQLLFLAPQQRNAPRGSTRHQCPQQQQVHGVWVRSGASGSSERPEGRHGVGQHRQQQPEAEALDRKRCVRPHLQEEATEGQAGALRARRRTAKEILGFKLPGLTLHWQ